MIRLIAITICSLIAESSLSQVLITAEELKFEASEKMVVVTPLSTDSNSSSYAIQIKKVVAPHYHANHTETIYVTKGQAEMQLGEKTLEIKEGDYINIPPKTVHSVKVTSSEPLEVISVQAPQFFGKDRIYIKDDQ